MATTEHQDTAADYWYKPGPTISEFHASKATIRVLVGGRGSGKTTAIAVEAVLKHAWLYAGARVYVLRKTETSNQDTTVETFEQLFQQSGTAYVETDSSLFRKKDGGRLFRLPSRKAVELYNQFIQTRPSKAALERWLNTQGDKWCSFLQFSGVPTSSHRASRFRGFECSLLILVESDQFERADVDMAVACLRWKSPDPSVCDSKGFIRDQGIILDTNPPGKRHWIAQWEQETSDNKDEGIRFWHIHTQENAHNLRPGYVDLLKRQYRNNPAMYKRMVEGAYADAFAGQPVLHKFSEDHVFEDLPFPKGALLVRGWDFGTTQAVVWSAYFEEDGDEHWWDLLEYFAEQSDADRQCQRVLELTGKAFPFWNDRAMVAGILDFCDPAGNAQRDTGRSVAVLNSYDIYPGFCRAPLQESIAAYNRLLSHRDKKGRLVYRLDKKGCPMLYEASAGGLRYPSEGEPGYGSDGPGKGPQFGNYDHISDASRYSKINLLKILREPIERTNPMVGPLGKPVKINRKRKWF